MKKMLKKGLLYSSIFFLMNACSQKSNSEKADSTQVIAGKNTPQEIIAPKIGLKNITIDSMYFAQKSAKFPVIDLTLFKKMGLGQLIPIEELSMNPSPKFRIIDTLSNNEKGKILIVSKETENEHTAWIIQYNTADKIEKSVVVFYEDFVEYLSNTKSKIQDGKMIITIESEGEAGNSKKTEKYEFIENHKVTFKNSVITLKNMAKMVGGFLFC